jgi:hypothetical protein
MRVYYRRETYGCAFSFLWAKELNAKDIHKEMFPVYGGKCLSGTRKAVHIWVEKFSQGRPEVADGAEVCHGTASR